MQIDTFVTGPLETNTYILTDGGAAVIIDPGGDADGITQALGARKLAAILLTHGHADHIVGLDELRARTGAPVHIHAADAWMLGDVAGNLSWMMEEFTVRPAEVLLKDRDRLQFGTIVFDVIHTPGHTRGGVCFDDGLDNLFSGDTLFCDGVGRSDFPGSDPAALAASIRDRLYPLGNRRVYPGHGPATTLAHERQHNPFVSGQDGPRQ